MLIIFGVVGVVRKLQEPPPADVKAEVTVGDGESRDMPVRIGASDVKLKVERKGSNFVITSENLPAAEHSSAPWRSEHSRRRAAASAGRSRVDGYDHAALPLLEVDADDARRVVANCSG